MKVPQSVTRAIGQTKLFANQNGPTILTITGVVGFATTAGLFHRAASKAQTVIEDLKAATEKQLNASELENWPEQQKIHVIGELWVGGIKELAKIYAPSLIVGGASIACVLAAHGIMKRQQGALVAAYAAIDATLRTYRERVREEYGEDKELELYRTRNERRREGVDDYGEACVINENDPRIASQYGRFFDPTSSNWSKTAEYNLTFLLQQQMYANDRLKARGYLFLNDVYRALGLRESQTGQVVGWRLKEYGGIDGYVDFGLDDIGDENSRAFRNLLDDCVFLDFNVDGPITVIE